MKIIKNQSGDTIVEVLLATVILSIVIAGAYTLSNKASQLNQASHERTRLSNLLQEQAEVLRAARDTNTEATGEVWDSIAGSGSSYLKTSLDSYNCKTDAINTSTAIPDSFHLVADPAITINSGLKNVDNDDIFFLWVEAIRGSGSSYVDFHINACWQAIGALENQQSGIVLRLEGS